MCEMVFLDELLTAQVWSPQALNGIAMAWKMSQEEPGTKRILGSSLPGEEAARRGRGRGGGPTDEKGRRVGCCPERAMPLAFCSLGLVPWTRGVWSWWDGLLLMDVEFPLDEH